MGLHTIEYCFEGRETCVLIFSTVALWHKGQGLKFDMKCHILHHFTTPNPLKEKSSDHFLKDLQKLKLLTNFDVNLTSFLGEAIKYVLNVYLRIPLGDEVRLTQKFVSLQSFLK